MTPTDLPGNSPGGGVDASVESTRSETAADSSAADRSNRSLRLAALILAVIPISLLGVASQLQPNSAGLGTHQQLGLPPCSMRVLVGIRCPGCGMTTSWSHFMHGQWMSSFQANAGGFLLAIFSIAFAWMSLNTCWTGRMPHATAQHWLGVALLSVAAVTLVDWTLRLAGV